MQFSKNVNILYNQEIATKQNRLKQQQNDASRRENDAHIPLRLDWNVICHGNAFLLIIIIYDVRAFYLCLQNATTLSFWFFFFPLKHSCQATVNLFFQGKVLHWSDIFSIAIAFVNALVTKSNRF